MHLIQRTLDSYISGIDVIAVLNITYNEFRGLDSVSIFRWNLLTWATLVSLSTWRRGQSPVSESLYIK
jgi:hypothetical protein